MEQAKSDRGWIEGIAGQDLITIGDPRLKAPCAAIANVADVQPLVKSMVTRLRELNGAGLAAPQIGESARVVVVEVRKTDVFPDRPISPLIVMINPEIVEGSGAHVSGWEGCFSVPGIMGRVPRHESITVKYLAEDGAELTRSFSGYVARVIQHEVDHLQGVEFVDRMPDMSSLTTVKNYISFHK